MMFFFKYNFYQEENIHPNVAVYVCEIKPTFTKQLLQFRDWTLDGISSLWIINHVNVKTGFH